MRALAPRPTLPLAHQARHNQHHMPHRLRHLLQWNMQQRFIRHPPKYSSRNQLREKIREQGRKKPRERRPLPELRPNPLSPKNTPNQRYHQANINSFPRPRYMNLTKQQRSNQERQQDKKRTMPSPHTNQYGHQRNAHQENGESLMQRLAQEPFPFKPMRKNHRRDRDQWCQHKPHIDPSNPRPTSFPMKSPVHIPIPTIVSRRMTIEPSCLQVNPHTSNTIAGAPPLLCDIIRHS